MAKALSQSSDIVLLRKVFTLLRVEKHLSASQEVIEIVIMAFRSSTVSEKVSARLLSIRSRSNGTALQHYLNSGCCKDIGTSPLL